MWLKISYFSVSYLVCLVGATPGVTRLAADADTRLKTPISICFVFFLLTRAPLSYRSLSINLFK